MVQDYKNATEGGGRTKQGMPRWAVLLILLIVAAFVAFLYFLNQQLPVASNPLEIIKSRDDVRTLDQAKAASETEVEDEKTAESAGPKFEFYNVLPELEVVLPQVENLLQPLLSKPVEPAKPVSVAKVGVAEKPDLIVKPKVVAVAVNKSIYLQVGSFKQREDAERRRVELILLGLNAKIQNARVKGAAWYRVRLGPYSSSADIAQVKTKLRKNRIKFLLIKG